MKKLIEYKLWAGQIPYFVDDPLGGVFNDGKCYGISKDTHDCYLPNTVAILSVKELAEVMQAASDLYKPSDTDPMECLPMDYADKAAYLDAWLAKHGIDDKTLA